MGGIGGVDVRLGRPEFPGSLPCCSAIWPGQGCLDSPLRVPLCDNCLDWVAVVDFQPLTPG